MVKHGTSYRFETECLTLSILILLSIPSSYTMGGDCKPWYILQCTMLLVKQRVEITIKNKNGVSKTMLVNLVDYHWWFEVEYQVLNTYTNISFSSSSDGATKYVPECIRLMYFFDRGYYFSTACFGAATIPGQVLFKCSVYFFGKPAGINYGWIGYIQVIQWQLLDVVSSEHSISVVSCQPWL